MIDDDGIVVAGVETLGTLPDRVTRVELQLAQLRDEMRGEFSVLRGEIRTGDEETRHTLRQDFRAITDETTHMLREEIRAGDEETRRYMRVLHEDVIARLTVIQEGQRPRRKQ